MDHMNVFFCFCQCFIWRTQKANTTGGYKSHLCFPITTNWNINKGLFDSLFVFPIEWHQTKKQKTAYTGDFAFFVFILLHCELKETKVCITDHISIFLFLIYELLYELHSYSFSIFYYEIGKRKTKGRYIHGPLKPSWQPGANMHLQLHIAFIRHHLCNRFK